MRIVQNINEDWYFSKENNENSINFNNHATPIHLPHTWNGIDGQDGGNDYYRNTCWYYKKLSKKDLPSDKQIYIEFNGTNASAVLYINGIKIASHDGGYSTWRANITDYLKEDNIIAVSVDNSVNDKIYPQLADFTFYGGIYRDVNLIFVDDSHFDLDYFGGNGVVIVPKIIGKNANIDITTYITGKADIVKVTILNDKNEIVAEQKVNADSITKLSLLIPDVHLWNGRKDPYLYKTLLTLIKNDIEIDQLCIPTGCRYFSVNSEKGFYLNGKSYPLRGVCRHQDRPVVGNAIGKNQHQEDIDMIMNIGANTIRLAHYQQDQYVYDLCDEKGLVIWAEIPYITKTMENGDENTRLQMKELIIQNINHPCICFWGLSNEITYNTTSNEQIIKNHIVLNNLCHKLDPTRLTTMAMIANCPMNDLYIKIPDVASWNLYMGWYGGTMDMNGPWLDEFHQKFPFIKIGLSEYGCEALNWHSSHPVRGDYSEEYQALFHESLAKQIHEREYIWASHVWNMFDFGADRRNEGGEAGMNHKGLVSFDRKYKKDAYYIYKAYWSKDPFIHICSKNYIDHVEDMVTIKIYTNLDEVELFANDISLGVQKVVDHIAKFEVSNINETKIKVINGNVIDEATIHKVEIPNEDYILADKKKVKNWFEN